VDDIGRSEGTMREARRILVVDDDAETVSSHRECRS
jgi:hypothetical protein